MSYEWRPGQITPSIQLGNIHTSRGENFLSRAEPVRPRNRDREPNNREEEIKHHDTDPEFEDMRIHPWG
jgi:hypothetical protein